MNFDADIQKRIMDKSMVLAKYDICVAIGQLIHGVPRDKPTTTVLHMLIEKKFTEVERILDEAIQNSNPTG